MAEIHGKISDADLEVDVIRLFTDNKELSYGTNKELEKTDDAICKPLSTSALLLIAVFRGIPIGPHHFVSLSEWMLREHETLCSSFSSLTV